MNHQLLIIIILDLNVATRITTKHIMMIIDYWW